jgi:hypothetical protein
MIDSPVKAEADALVQLLMEVHAQGLARVLEIAARSAESGDALLALFGKDDIAGALLLLYSLHPDGLETRVQSAVGRMRPQLLVHGCDVSLESMGNGAVRLRVTWADKAVRMKSKDVRAIVENAVLECAPDVSTIEIIGLEVQHSSGFVALESLLAPASAGKNSTSGELSAGSVGQR